MHPDFKLNFYIEKSEIKSSECQYYEMWDYIFFFILSVFFKFSIEDKHVFYNAKSHSKAFNEKKYTTGVSSTYLVLLFFP